MSSISVERLKSDQWQMLKNLRLRALEDAPYAFGTTLAEGLERTDQYWREMAQDHATLPDRAYFIAFNNNTPCGMAGCYLQANQTAMFTAMWVAPETRGKSVGTKIIDTIIAWARDNGKTILDASVSENNPARTFYQNIGFFETGETEPLRSNPSVQILLIRRDIAL